MFDIEKFRYVQKIEVPQQKQIVKPVKVQGQFLKGPIPLNWLSECAKLSGKAALSVGLALWFQSGRTKSKTVTLTNKVMQLFSHDRRTKYEGLRQLENAKLVKVSRRKSKNPEVTILEQSVTALD